MDRNPEAPRRAPYIGAAAVAIAVILVARLLTGHEDPGQAASDPSGGALPRSGCTQLVVVSSTEKAALLGEVGDAYDRAGHEVDGRCTSVSVVAKNGGATTDALVRGWNEDTDGPRPDVWTPVSSSWLEILTQRFAEKDVPNLVPAEVGHVAVGPTVIAMPRPMAEAMGWPKAAIGWRDIFDLASDPAGWGRFGHPEWGRFRLGKTNPNFSTSGLNTLIGEYYAATGTSNDLTVPDISDPKVVAFVKGVESSAVHYGDISITFLQNLRRADDAGLGLTYISAVAIEEKSVWDYNHGNPTGDPATLGKLSPPQIPLVAVYPKEGTIVNDHPYATLDAAWVDDAKRDVAADFLRFVQSPAQQARFQAAAFRDFRGKAGPEISQANGVLPDQPKIVLAPPSAPVLDAIQRSWSQTRKRARVLLIVDVSGSMGDQVPTQAASKLELAKQAAASALDQFADDDEVGLWIFSTGLGANGSPFTQLLPIAPIGPNRDAMKTKIRSLAPAGGTGLYATLRSAVGSMEKDFDTTRINGVVILTDGRNEYQADTDLDGLLDRLKTEEPDRAIRVFPIAYGADADLVDLRRIAEASFGVAYDASDPSTIDKVFAAVLSNF